MRVRGMRSHHRAFLLRPSTAAAVVLQTAARRLPAIPASRLLPVTPAAAAAYAHLRAVVLVMLATVGRGRGPAEPCSPPIRARRASMRACGSPHGASRASLSQWRHAGHNRDRVVAGQDAERRRIQRILHDGVQQEIVALSARAGLVRQQLLRGTRPRPGAWPRCSAIWPPRCTTSGRSPTRSIRRCCPIAGCSRRSRLSPAGWPCRWRSAPTRGCAACGSASTSR